MPSGPGCFSGCSGSSICVAFWSLGTQVRGLVGADGILPAQELMMSARQWADAEGLGVIARFFALPTVCWLGVERPRARVAMRDWRGALALPDRGPGQRARPAAAVAAVSVALHRLRRVPVVPVGHAAAGNGPAGDGARALDADPPAARRRAARDITLADLVAAVPPDVCIGRRQADQRRSDVARPDGGSRSLRDAAAADAARMVRAPPARPGFSSFPPPPC